MISFIIPAHHEEALISRCVDAVHAAMVEAAKHMRSSSLMMLRQLRLWRSPVRAGRTPSVVVLGRAQVLGSGESADKLTRIMDQHGEMLRADPDLLPAILQRNQRSCLRITLTGKASLRLVVTHQPLQTLEPANEYS